MGYSYTASTWICSSVLWTRLIGLFLAFNESSTDRYRCRCNLGFSIFSAQVLQILSWSLTLSMLYRLRNKFVRKLPWILRSWWIFSFLDNMIKIGLEIHKRSSSSSSSSSSPTVEQHIDYSNLIPCFYMFWFSIRGTTGITITLIESPDISEPLLPNQTQFNPESSSVSKSPYAKASLLQLITFSWLNPLVLNQVPELDTGDSAEFLSHSLGEIMRRSREKGRFDTSLLYRSIFLFFRKKAIINAIFSIVSVGAD